MVERTVFLKLNDEWAPRRAEVATYSEQVLKGIDEVLSVWVGVAMDDRSAEDWDVCLIVGLSDGDDLEPYQQDPGHRAYVDEYLRPKMTKIKAWNFERA